MKKIINGKLYNTETARLVWELHDYLPFTDFNHKEDAIYQKKTGEYFRFKGSYEIGQGWIEKIVPLTYNDAKYYAEINMSTDEYEAEFGKVSEDDSRTTMTISVSAKCAETAKRIAAEKGISVSALIEGLVIGE